MKHDRKRSENTIDKGFRGVLRPTREQAERIEKTFGCCRYVFNSFLDERIREYRERGKTLTYTEQCAKLPLLKKDPKTSWLGEVDSTALQSSVRALQDSYDAFFRGQTGFPKFKSKHSHRQSFRSTNNNGSIRLVDRKHIRLPKLGEVRCRFPMEVQGKILSAVVTKEPDGKYGISLNCEVPRPPEPEKTGKAVGIDLGIRTLAVTSDGKEYDNPKTYEKNLRKLRRTQRKLSRKTRGGRNWEKQRKKVAKVHQKIRNQRTDAIHKMTHELVYAYDLICIEDLDVREMIKGKLARGITDASFGEIRRQLAYKTEWTGKRLIVTERWYPSSQVCSGCGYVNRDAKDLKIRRWRCPQCGQEHDRDLNAAKNILREGLRTAG